MKKIVLFLCLIPALASARISHGGDEINNGGGIAEQNVVFAWLSLRQLLTNFCVHTECTTDEGARGIAARIRSHLGEELLDGQVIFVAGSKRPDLFPDPSAPLATDAHWGAKVYVNDEKLSGDENPVEIVEAMDFLMRAVLRHAQVDEGSGRTLLQFVLTLAQGRLGESSLVSFNQPGVRLLSWNDSAATRLLAADQEKTLDLTALVLAKLECPSGSQRISASVTNMAWSAPLPWDEQSRQQSFAFTGDAFYDCRSGAQAFRMRADLQGLLSAEVTVNGRPDADWMRSTGAVVNLIRDSAKVMVSNRRRQ